MGIELWAQAVGALAAVLGVSAYQLKHERLFVIGLAGAAALWAVHFLLLGALTAALMNVINVARNVCAISVKGKARRLGYVFIAGYLTVGMLTWEAAWDVLPTLAVCVGSAGLFFASGLTLRAALMTGGLLWLIFNIHVGSVPGMVIMLVETISNGAYIGRTLLQRREAARGARGSGGPGDDHGMRG